MRRPKTLPRLGIILILLALLCPAVLHSLTPAMRPLPAASRVVKLRVRGFRNLKLARCDLEVGTARNIILPGPGHEIQKRVLLLKELKENHEFTIELVPTDGASVLLKAQLREAFDEEYPPLKTELGAYTPRLTVTFARLGATYTWIVTVSGTCRSAPPRSRFVDMKVRGFDNIKLVRSTFGTFGVGDAKHFDLVGAGHDIEERITSPVPLEEDDKFCVQLMMENDKTVLLHAELTEAFTKQYPPVETRKGPLTPCVEVGFVRTGLEFVWEITVSGAHAGSPTPYAVKVRIHGFQNIKMAHVSFDKGKRFDLPGPGHDVQKKVNLAEKLEENQKFAVELVMTDRESILLPAELRDSFAKQYPPIEAGGGIYIPRITVQSKQKTTGQEVGWDITVSGIR